MEIVRKYIRKYERGPDVASTKKKKKISKTYIHETAIIHSFIKLSIFNELPLNCLSIEIVIMELILWIYDLLKKIKFAEWTVFFIN